MPTHHLVRATLAALAAVALLRVAPGAAQSPTQLPAPVAIALRPAARADGPIICIGHAAHLDGGDATLRAAIAALDVADFPDGQPAVVVGRDEVKYRLLIAGYDPRLFRITGSARCLVRRSNPAVTEAKITEAARQIVLSRVPPSVGAVTIRPAGPVPPPALDPGPSDRVVLHAELAQGGVAVGKTRASVAVVVNGQKRATVPVVLDVLPASAAVPASLQAKAGAPATGDPTEPVIRVRDRVKMIARVGGSQVFAIGEAQQDGRLGQSIRVRNIDSNKTVQGRVCGPGVVEVEY